MSETQAAPPVAPEASGPPRIPVRFLTVCLDPGLPEQPLVLYPKDEYRIEANGDIVVEFREYSQETIRFREKWIRWHSESEGFAPARDPNAPDDPVQRYLRELRERSGVR